MVPAPAPDGSCAPDRWLREVLSPHLGGTPAGPASWVDWSAVVGDEPLLRDVHARLQVQDGATPAAVAKWLCAWTAGAVAAGVGLGLATAGVGLVVAPERVRWGLHADGWVDRVELGAPQLLVAAGHPWVGQPGVQELADDGAVRTRTVHALVELLTPLVERCRGLAKVGRPALWAEVADALGMTVAHRPELAVSGAVVEELQRVLRVAGVPWRTVPTLGLAPTATGPTYVGRKGGCCLAYLSTPDAPEGEPDAEHQAYLERFPPVPGEPAYCSTCSLRTVPDTTERQVFWVENARAARLWTK